MSASDSTMDRFADALAEHDAFARPPRKGGNVAKAARAVGISESYGRVLLQRMCKALGEKAR